MLTKIIFIVVSSSVLLFCRNARDSKADRPDVQPATHDSLRANVNVIQPASEKAGTDTNGTYAKISPKSVIEILSLNKGRDTSSKFLKLYSAKCSAWTLSKRDMKNIFLTSKEIDGQEVHHYYDVLPCYYSGKATIDGRLASYELNAGAFVVLMYKDTSIYLGYKKDDYKNYFLTGPGIE